MAIQVTAEVVAHSTARDAHYPVLLALAWYARREDGVCWPSQATLAAWSRRSVRQVQRSLRWLEQAGELRRLKPGGAAGSGDVTYYQVTVGAYRLAKPPAVLPVGKGDRMPPFAPGEGRHGVAGRATGATPESLKVVNRQEPSPMVSLPIEVAPSGRLRLARQPRTR